MVIRPITIHDALLWVEWMDHAHQDYHPEWAGCYCRFFVTDCPMNEWKEKLGEYNRSEAIKAIENGFMHGNLAFIDDKIVGWVHAGHWENFLRLQPNIQPYVTMDTAMIVCFYVDVAHRQKGIMNALLEYTLNDLKGLGYTQVLVMPEAEVMNDSAFNGSIAWYEAHGFSKIQSTLSRPLLKKEL